MAFVVSEIRERGGGGGGELVWRGDLSPLGRAATPRSPKRAWWNALALVRAASPLNGDKSPRHRVHPVPD